MRTPSGWLAGLAVFLVCEAAPGGQYFQDFSSTSVGDTSFGDGSQLVSTHPGSVAKVEDGTLKELQLTDGGGTFVTTAFLLPDLDTGKVIHAFSARWNSQVFGDFTNAADGFSFNFGPTTNNLLSGAVEQGYPTGLSVCIQTYIANNPGFALRVNGKTHAFVPYNPLTQWGSFNSTRHLFEVDWNYTNGLTLRVDGQTVLDRIPTYGFVPRPGHRFVWAARTGLLVQEVRLDNIVIVTGGTLVKLATTSPHYTDSGNGSATNAFDENAATSWTIAATNGFVGATLAPSNHVRAYSLTSGSINRTQDPRTWTLEGSNNGGTNWAVCGSGGGAFQLDAETRFWLATNPAAFAAARLNVSANSGNLFTTALGELQLYRFVPDLGPTWQLISVGGMNTNWWTSIALSADGSILLAASQYDFTWLRGYYSETSWTRMDSLAPTSNWSAVAIARSNKYGWASAINPGWLYALPQADFSGPNWFLPRAFSNVWTALAMSADGRRVYAAAHFDQIHVSTNAGQDWTEQVSSGARQWRSLASSANGSNLVAAVYADGIYISTNAGATWSEPVDSNAAWTAVSSSMDGMKLAAVSDIFGLGKVLVSTNGGVTWVDAGLPSNNWRGVACSYDGSRLVASSPQGVYRSIDAGSTWVQINTNVMDWRSVASSADGNKLAFATYDDGIWLYNANEPVPLPAVTLQYVSINDFTNVTLHATVSAGGIESGAQFEWGTNTSYGNTTSVQGIGHGTNALGIQAQLTGLEAPRTYHFRAVVTNAAGVALGPDVTFSVLAPDQFVSIALPGNAVIPTSANSPPQQQAPMAIDGILQTKYLNVDEFNTGFTVYPAVTSHVVHALGLFSAEDAPERSPASYAIFGSSNGTDFSLIDSNAVPVFPWFNSIVTIPFRNTNTYPIYKVVFPDVRDSGAANSMQIAEVELLPYGEITAPNDDITLELGGGASLTAESAPKGLLDRRLIEPSNKVVVVDTAFLVTRAILTPASGPSIAKAIQLIGAYDDMAFPGRTPATLTVEGVRDVTNYTALLVKDLAAPATNLQLYGYSFLANTNTFETYRISLGWPQSGNVLQVGEIRLFGIPSATMQIARAESGLVLSWPDHAGSYWLQQAASPLGLPWTYATNDVLTTDGVRRATVPTTNTTGVFRLLYP